MSKLSERQRLIVTIAVSVVLTGGLLGLILKDRSEIEKVEQEIASLDQRIRAADQEIRRTKEREDKVLVFRAVESRELAILPRTQMIATFHNDLSTFLSEANLRFHELPESTPQESGLAKGIYVTRNALKFQGDAASTLKFVNRIESDPRLIAVKALKVEGGERPRDDMGSPVLHDVEMQLETYYYNPEAGAVDRVHIPGAEARLQQADIREAIAAFQPERPDTYVLRPSASRRDPLIDPRRAASSSEGDPDLEEFQRQELLVFDLEKRMDDIDELVEQERALGDISQLFRRDRIANQIEKQLNELRARISQIDHSKAISFPELVQRMARIRARTESLSGQRPQRTLVVSADLARDRLEAISEMLDRGDYAEVEVQTSEWSQFLAGKQVDTDAKPVLEQIEFLRVRARTLSEFKSIPIRVTGTIVNPHDEDRSVALINGRPMHVGDPLDGKDEVVLSRIERQAVLFTYQGESIRVERKQGAGQDKPRAGARRP